MTPDTVGSHFFSPWISTYEAGAYVESRSHRVQEQIYHVLAGGGILTVDGERRLIRVNNITYIPPGVVHEFHNAGLDPLASLVITRPRNDEEPQPR